MRLIDENLYCQCARSQRSHSTKEGFVTTSHLGWKHTNQYCKNVKIYCTETREIFTPFDFCLWQEVEKSPGRVLRVHYCTEQNACMWCLCSWYAVWFPSSIMHQNENLLLRLVNYKWHKELQSADRPDATGFFQPYCLHLFTSIERRMECIFVYMFFCTIESLVFSTWCHSCFTTTNETRWYCRITSTTQHHSWWV